MKRTSGVSRFRRSIEIETIASPYWAPTLEFKLHLSEPKNCTLGLAAKGRGTISCGESLWTNSWNDGETWNFEGCHPKKQFADELPGIGLAFKEPIVGCPFSIPADSSHRSTAFACPCTKSGTSSGVMAQVCQWDNPTWTGDVKHLCFFHKKRAINSYKIHRIRSMYYVYLCFGWQHQMLPQEGLDQPEALTSTAVGWKSSMETPFLPAGTRISSRLLALFGTPGHGFFAHLQSCLFCGFGKTMSGELRPPVTIFWLVVWLPFPGKWLVFSSSQLFDLGEPFQQAMFDCSIVALPSKNGGSFHSYVNVDQEGSLIWWERFLSSLIWCAKTILFWDLAAHKWLQVYWNMVKPWFHYADTLW